MASPIAFLRIRKIRLICVHPRSILQMVEVLPKSQLLTISRNQVGKNFSQRREGAKKRREKDCLAETLRRQSCGVSVFPARMAGLWFSYGDCLLIRVARNAGTRMVRTRNVSSKIPSERANPSSTMPAICAVVMEMKVPAMMMPQLVMMPPV